MAVAAEIFVFSKENVAALSTHNSLDTRRHALTNTVGTNRYARLLTRAKKSAQTIITIYLMNKIESKK